ncbi:MAG: hypothetical protein CM15mP77_0530 [Synechococcus sp.]|nr:MAG: hypothetical protein CM15mP77_0530 [Synechococcus sp.]
MGARITQDEFLKRARQRFGDQFDYSQILWRSFKSPVKIRCKHHPVQEITITPEKHLQTLGGCRHCLREGGLPPWNGSSTAGQHLSGPCQGAEVQAVKLTR